MYARHEYFVPGLLLCSDVLYAGLKILRPHLKLDKVKAKGKLVIGVAQGDIHDIERTWLLRCSKPQYGKCTIWVRMLSSGNS